MDDAVEQLAEAISFTNPVTVDGRALEWSEIVRFHPDRAAEYREAATNRIRAEQAMQKLDGLEPPEWAVRLREDR